MSSSVKVFNTFLGLTIAASIFALLNAHIGWRGYLFDLSAHFSPHLLLLSVVFGIVLIGDHRWRLAGLFAIVAFLHGAVVLPASMHVSAPLTLVSNANRTLSIAAANLLGKEASFNKFFTEASTRQVDLIAVSEAPTGACALAQAITDVYEYCFYVDKNDEGKFLSRRIMLILRQPPDEVKAHFDPAFMRRGFIEATFNFDSEPLSVLIVHPVSPGTPSHLKARDAMLHAVGEVAAASDSEFVVIGDLNTTPWADIFDVLPGRTVGNPLMHSTWLTNFPLIGLPIDHVLISDRVAATSFEVGSFNGSDHRPLFTTINIKTDKDLID